jgi:hypothetical protein
LAASSANYLIDRFTGDNIMHHLRPNLTAATVVAMLVAATVNAADLPSPAAPPEPKEMKALFNGKDLSGWEGDQRLWSFRDGVVRGETTKENPAQGNTFVIWRDGELKDFDLRLSFRIERGNSGVQYRSKQVPGRGENRWVISGYQAEVENTPGKVGFLYHERGRGYLCNVGEKVMIGDGGKPQVVGRLGDREKIGETYKKSAWNDYVIIAEGNHLRHYLNGMQTVDVIDNDPKGSARSGLLALQIHAGPPMVVEFKNVRLKQYDQAK